METSAANILEIGVVLSLATAAGWAVRRVGLPAVVGYLAVGLAVSPFTPGYTANRDQLQTLADIGVVLLLFEVGIEIDPLRLRREQGRLLWSVPVQVMITLALGAAAGWGMGLNPRGGMLLGLAVALSSSVVVINITRSRRRTTNPAAPTPH
jgi:CPA2 family monovalent cation:H+ antiporter-2